MSDNLFDRLFELFQTTDKVNWALAEEIIKSIAGERRPIEPQLAEEYQELSLAAQLQLTAAGLLEAGASTIPDPIDPSGWARANHRSYAYLMEPLADALGGGVPPESPMAAALGPLGPAISGLQAGSMVGTMSSRVMGQFDASVPPLDQTRAYLVVPNIESFASEHALDRRQVRLWANLQELVAHDLLSRPTVRTALERAVAHLVEGIDFDPAGLMEKLGELRDPAALDAMLGDADGIAGIFGGEGGAAAAGPFRALNAFLAGYGDWVVARAAGSMLPDLEEIADAHGAHRSHPDESLDQLRGLIGVSIDRTEAADGLSFCEEVERRWGDESLERLWEDPAHLPGAGELGDPVGWAARVLLD